MAITLNSGFKMPIIGLGVWRMEGQAIKDLIINSIKIGYRHFDCAGNFFYFFTPSNLDFNLVF
jgi:diketogulonate reductase-like aldo/keto reductase